MNVICLCAAWCETCGVERDGAELFYGALPPQHEHLRRLLQSLEKS